MCVYFDLRGIEDLILSGIMFTMNRDPCSYYEGAGGGDSHDRALFRRGFNVCQVQVVRLAFVKCMIRIF